MMSNGQASRRRYDGIDNFRVFAALGIVFSHVCLAHGRIIPEMIFLPRTISLPFFVTAAVFLTACSLVRHPERSFTEFMSARWVRIEIPFLIWTAVYWLIYYVIRAIAEDGEPRPVPAGVVLLGWGHLWFLQFLFLTAAVLFPLLRTLVRRGMFGSPWFAAFAAASAFPALHLTKLKRDGIRELSPELEVFAFLVCNYIPFMLLGMALASQAARVAALLEKPAVRILSLAVVVAAGGTFLFLHSGRIPKFLFAASVIVAAMQPWPEWLSRALRPAARYSFAIYILHMFAAYSVVGLLTRAGVTDLYAVTLGGTVIAFGATWAAAALLRLALPQPWFIPLVEVEGESPLRPTRPVRPADAPENPVGGAPVRGVPLPAAAAANTGSGTGATEIP